MASGYTPAGMAYYYCEKCGQTRTDFTDKNGRQDRSAAAEALRAHMVEDHNNGG